MQRRHPKLKVEAVVTAEWADYLPEITGIDPITGAMSQSAKESKKNAQADVPGPSAWNTL